MLPQYRGAAPINWALINGETKTGVTSFFIDEKIDTGATLLYKECAIDKDDTAGIVHDKLMLLGAALATETCDAIFSNTIQAKIQADNEQLKEAPKLFKANCRIDWHKSAQEIHNHIRGLSPYPVAWTLLTQPNSTEIVIKLHKSSYTLCEHQNEPGFIKATKSDLQIFTKDGFINVLEIQTSGKKRMPISAFLNGIDINSNMVAL